MPCNNRPLSHWQSLIIQDEEESSHFPTIKSFTFPIFYVSFLLPLSVLCNLSALTLFSFSLCSRQSLSFPVILKAE